MKNKKKQFTIFLFVIALCFMSLKLDLQSTQLGHYRGIGYNFFSAIYEEPIQDRALLIANMPATLVQAYGAQGVNLDRVDLDTADIKIWGPVIDAQEAPADRIYNVVFHPDVQRWRASDADFNTNLLVGLFTPNGVVQAARGEAIPFNTFGMVNVNKHDQIYYSPDNGRFQLQPGRAIVTFWTVALSEDKRKTVIAFNIIIDEPILSAAIGNIVSDSESSDDDDNEMIDQIAAFVASHANISAADKQAMHDAIVLIQRVTGMSGQDREVQERAARARQEEADRQMAERLMQEEMARVEAQQRADQEAAARQAAEQARLQAEQEQQRIQAEALRAQQEQERIRREAQEAADREMAQRLMQDERAREEAQQRADQEAARQAAEREQARIQTEALRAQQEQERIRRAQQGATSQGLSRAERIAREQAAEQAAMDAILKRKR